MIGQLKRFGLTVLFIALPAWSDTLMVSGKATGEALINVREQAATRLLNQLFQNHKEQFLKQKIAEQLQTQTSQSDQVLQGVLPTTWFLSPSIEKAIMAQLKTQSNAVPDGLQIQVGLTQLGLREVYRAVTNSIETEQQQRLSENQRKLLYWTADQLHSMLTSLPTKVLPELREMSSFAEQLKQQIAQNLFPGKLIFTNLTDQMNLWVDDTPVADNQLTLASGLYPFRLEQAGFYALDGRLQVVANTTQSVFFPLIVKPEVTPKVYLSSNLDSELLPYIERALDSYGWSIDSKAAAGFMVHMQEQMSHLDEAQRNYTLSLVYEVDSPQRQAANLDRILKQQRYYTEVIIGINDKLSIEREKRVLMIQSLMQFLALFEQADFAYLTQIRD